MPLHPARYTIEGTLVVKETVHEQSDRGEDGNSERRDEMRKLVAVTQMTLDGVMQALGGPEEDPSGGFEQGGWSVNYFDEVLEEAIGEAMARPFDLLLGRKTYEIFAAHWPYDEGPIAERFNGATKYVASRTLDRLEWNNSTLLEGEVETAVAALKEGDLPGRRRSRKATVRGGHAPGGPHARRLEGYDERRHRRHLPARGTDPDGLVRFRGAHRAGDRAPQEAGRLTMSGILCVAPLVTALGCGLVAGNSSPSPK
jgi:dihydrofolate reductase